MVEHTYIDTFIDELTLLLLLQLTLLFTSFVTLTSRCQTLTPETVILVLVIHGSESVNCKVTWRRRCQ